MAWKPKRTRESHKRFRVLGACHDAQLHCEAAAYHPSEKTLQIEATNLNAGLQHSTFTLEFYGRGGEAAVPSLQRRLQICSP